MFTPDVAKRQPHGADSVVLFQDIVYSQTWAFSPFLRFPRRRMVRVRVRLHRKPFSVAVCSLVPGWRSHSGAGGGIGAGGYP